MFLMERDIWGNSKEGNITVKEQEFSLMEISMKGNGRMATLMVMGHTLFLMEEVLLGYGKIVLLGIFLDITKKGNSLIMLMEKEKSIIPAKQPPSNNSS